MSENKEKEVKTEAVKTSKQTTEYGYGRGGRLVPKKQLEAARKKANYVTNEAEPVKKG